MLDLLIATEAYSMDNMMDVVRMRRLYGFAPHAGLITPRSRTG